MTLTKYEISEIRSRLQAGEKCCDLAKEFGVSASFVSQIKNNKKCVKQVWLTLEEASVIVHALWVLEQEAELEDEEKKVADRLEKILINEATKHMEAKYMEAKLNETE